jgi:hypothetical protein
MYCDIHNKEFKGPNKRGNMWHVIDFDKGEFCNKPLNMMDGDVEPAKPQGNSNSPTEFQRSMGNTSSRIERQHSQDMGIQTVGLMLQHGEKYEGQEGLMEWIKSLTDEFQDDLKNS